jgi:hypothetical protein
LLDVLLLPLEFLEGSADDLVLLGLLFLKVDQHSLGLHIDDPAALDVAAMVDISRLEVLDRPAPHLLAEPSLASLQPQPEPNNLALKGFSHRPVVLGQEVMLGL